MYVYTYIYIYILVWYTITHYYLITLLRGLATFCPQDMADNEDVPIDDFVQAYSYSYYYYY